MFYPWRPYVSVVHRRQRAARELARLSKKGHRAAPVIVEGRAIARTFWGKAWCDNLERYSDFANRLPRGRTYVRNGSVIDLQIAGGAVTALVSGSRIYKVTVKVASVPKTRWRAICRDCTGAIDSLVELLQGRFSKGVMERLCQEKTGLFPPPAEIEFACSCPDWATMCKHVAAVLYGVGARLDERPELLFALRQADEKDLITRAGSGIVAATPRPTSSKILDRGDLSGIFEIELAQDEPPGARRTRGRSAVAPPPAPPAPRRRAGVPRAKAARPSSAGGRARRSRKA